MRFIGICRNGIEREKWKTRKIKRNSACFLRFNTFAYQFVTIYDCKKRNKIYLWFPFHCSLHLLRDLFLFKEKANCKLEKKTFFSTFYSELRIARCCLFLKFDLLYLLDILISIAQLSICWFTSVPKLLTSNSNRTEKTKFDLINSDVENETRWKNCDGYTRFRVGEKFRSDLIN